MKHQQNTLWGLSLALWIGIPVCLIYLTFSNSKDCSQLVIDSYEIHSGIDIPAVEFVNCYYDEKSQTRISVYDLKAEINTSAFEELKSLAAQADILQGQVLLEEHEQPTASTLYVASGESGDTKWTYLLDADTQRLWAELVY